MAVKRLLLRDWLSGSAEDKAAIKADTKEASAFVTTAQMMANIDKKIAGDVE